MLRLDLAALPEGNHQLHLTPSAADLDLDPDAFRDLRVNLTLHYQNADPRAQRLEVEVEVAATARLECDRTLILFEQEVHGQHQIRFLPASVLPEESISDEVQPLPENEIVIDLTAPVRDTLLLAVPMRRIAPGADAQDLPSQFGAPLDEEGRPYDPRWEALRGLRPSSSDS